MHVALPPQNTHLVFRIDIAALVYEQLGNIERVCISRQHQGCPVVLRSHVRAHLMSIVMCVHSHNKCTVGVHAMFPACCVALRAVHKHSVSLTHSLATSEALD